MIRYDSERIVQICLRRNIRAGGGELPRIGDSCHVSIFGKWRGRWRRIGVISPNCLAVADHRITKVDSGRIRRSQTIHEDAISRTPNEPSSPSNMMSRSMADSGSAYESGNARVISPVLSRANANYLDSAIRDRWQEGIPEKIAGTP